MAKNTQLSRVMLDMSADVPDGRSDDFFLQFTGAGDSAGSGGLVDKHGCGNIPGKSATTFADDQNRPVFSLRKTAHGDETVDFTLCALGSADHASPFTGSLRENVTLTFGVRPEGGAEYGSDFFIEDKPVAGATYEPPQMDEAGSVMMTVALEQGKFSMDDVGKLGVTVKAPGTLGANEGVSVTVTSLAGSACICSGNAVRAGSDDFAAMPVLAPQPFKRVCNPGHTALNPETVAYLLQNMLKVAG